MILFRIMIVSVFQLSCWRVESVLFCVLLMDNLFIKIKN
jgi:hypothetical protein